MRRRLRRLGAPLAVAAARLRARRGSALLVVLGVAASTAVIAGTFGASVAMRDDVTRRALASLPPGDRSFRVDAFDLVPGQRYADVDRTVTAALTAVAPGTPVRGEFLHRLRIGKGLVQLAGIDDPARALRLRSGRWPHACTARRCEVVAVGSSASAVLAAGDLRLVRVGVAEAGPTVFGETLASGGGSVTALVARGSTAFDHIAALDGFYRSYSWVDPVEPRGLHVWDVSRILARETRAQAELAPLGDTFRLAGPDDALVGARDRGRVGARRLLLFGGELGVLLLGFALVAAVGLRAGVAAERRRLLARGASPAQTSVAVIAEVAATTAAGALFGTALAASLVAAAAGGGVLAHALAAPAAVAALAGGWALATAAAVAVARAEPEARRRRLGMLDVAALGAAAAVALSLARGGVSASASGGDATLLLLVPPLALFAVAVAATRLLAPLARSGERLARRGPLAARLALVAVARAPGRTLAAFAFLLVSVALALFAVGYRSTLERGAADEAAFAVPLDFTVAEGQRLVEPLRAAPLARYRAIGTDAYPVVRQTADVPGPGTTTLSPTVVGIPPSALTRIRWRGDFAAHSPAELAQRLTPRGRTQLRMLVVPSQARALSLRVRIAGAPLALRLLGLDSAGDAVAADLGERPAGLWTLSAHPPRALRRLVGLELSLATAEETSIAHRAAEDEVAAVSQGTVDLGPLRADGRVVTRWDGWVARGDGAAVARRAPLRLAYSFGVGGTALLRRPQPTDGRPVPVLASASVAHAAGPHGRLVLDFQQARIPAQVVAVAARFPAVGDDFLVADERQLATALDADAPGLGAARELWLAASPAAATPLARPPFASLAVTSRRQLEHALRSDPLARSVARVLAAAALVALALAVLGFWVAAAGDLRDEARTLFDLEAQGVAPAELRRQFRLRSILVVGLAVGCGVGVGVLLTHATVALVRISSTGAAPEPPLRFAGDWPLVAGGGIGFVLACAVALELTARRYLRAEAPPRASWSLG